MFRYARIKLTVWYLLIILFISMVFSMAIYREAEHELGRIERRQRVWSERNRGESPRSYRPDLLEPIQIKDIRKRIISTLVFVNGFILIFSGGLGYFLAGKTLKPIQEMVDEQNQFISDASHELRTPLTALKSAMEVFLRDKKLLLSDAKTLVTQNIEDVNKLQSLSDGLLQLTQYQKPNGHTQMQRALLSKVIREAVRKIQPLAKQKTITIEFSTSDYTIKGDEYALTDLLVILLDNAVKYSHKGSTVIINVKKADSTIAMSVRDEGIGIEKKDLPHIFDRFYRADSARSKTKTGGYGLGLSIAKKIIETHHGTIKVESKQGQGSTFIVQFPTA